MIGPLVYLACLAIVALWLRARPRLGLPATLGLWWVGLLLARLAPGLLPGILPGSGQLSGTGPTLTLVLGAVGGIAFLRALLNLLLWERPRSRKRWILGSLFSVALVMGAFGWVQPWLLVLIASSFLGWVRWRKVLGAGGLALATITGAISIVLCIVSWGSTSGPEGSLAAGLLRFRDVASRAALIYCLIAIVPISTRIHLSIRSIGRRLVVSHLLAGLVPGALAVTFILTTGGLYLSTYRGELGANLLAETSRGARGRLARYLTLPERDRPFPYGDETYRQSVLTRIDGGPAVVTGAALAFSPDSLLLTDVRSQDVPLLLDGGVLFLRARIDTVFDGRSVRAEALAPIDSLRMVRISRVLGIPVRLSPSMEVSRKGSSVSIGMTDSTTTTSGSIGPPRPEGRRLPGGTIVPCLIRADGAWVQRSIPLSSSSGVWEPFKSLFSTARDNPIAVVVLLALGVIAFLFIAALAITAAMVYRMGGTITEAVRALIRATAALGEGKLDYRIPIQGKDELWTVAGSFNEMAEGLQRVRQMELQNERLEEELRIARQIQNRLLPAAAPVLDHFELAGKSLPAREVGGDYFDYIVLPDGRIGLAVADVSGKGAGAALLMSSFRASLRSQDLGGQGPARTLAALNRFVCSSVDPGKFITAFLAVLDPRTGELLYSNGGHEPPMLIKDGMTFRELSEGGLILGAFAQAEYEEGSVRMPADSILAIFTDGVTEAQNKDGDFFGSERLMEVLASRDSRPCPELLEQILGEIQSFAGEAAQSDDITLLLARKE
jgi:serine phosphatase RsbU (regulator of sigma subunit)